MKNRGKKICAIFWWILLMYLLLIFISIGIVHCEDIVVNAPTKVKQGGYIKIEIKGRIQKEPYDVLLRDNFADIRKTESFRFKHGMQMALLPIATLDKPGQKEIVIKGNNFLYLKKIEIENVYFPVSRGVQFIGNPKPAILKRLQYEQEELKEIFSHKTETIFFERNLAFSPPLETLTVTQIFGKIWRKRYEGDSEIKLKPHKGIDLRAPIGTPVFTVENGIIVMAKSLLGSGNTVIIDHGRGVFSLYFHLKKFKVNKFRTVKQGELIALSGNTGKSQGPHLHFETRIYDIPVDPSNFIGGIE